MRTLCYFTDTTEFGGAEQSLLNLAAQLDRGRWQPRLLYHPAPGLEPLLCGARKLELELCPVPRLPEGLVGARRVPALAARLRRWRPDVFHAHLIWPLACKFGLLAAILARVPAIVATEQVFVQFKLDRSIYLQQRLVAAGVGRYLPVSRDLARRLRQRLPIPEHKLQVIYNGIPPETFQRGAAATPSQPGQRRPVVLTVARLNSQKGLPYLVEAAAQVPEAQFWLAGDGPERGALEAQANSLGLGDRIQFLGFRADIAALLEQCDVFVLPSLYEGAPLSILEAMASGKPVVATDIGGTNEVVVPDDTGLLVPPADAAALAGAIRAVLADPARARRLGLAGQARVTALFSAAGMARQVTQVYDELLA